LVNISSLPSFIIIFVIIILVILGLSYWYEWERYALVWGFN
jgi:NADH:ubiquinone oxidoreductase subunit 3 (subunit A)